MLKTDIALEEAQGDDFIGSRALIYFYLGSWLREIVRLPRDAAEVDAPPVHEPLSPRTPRGRGANVFFELEATHADAAQSTVRAQAHGSLQSVVVG